MNLKTSPSTKWTLMIILLLPMCVSSSTSQKYYLETKEIIEYCVNLFETLIRYHEMDWNILNILRNESINNPKIQQLSDVKVSNIFDMFSCQHEKGFDYISNVLESFDKEYEDFENYLLHRNDPHYEFPTNNASIYKSVTSGAYFQTSLHCKNIEDSLNNEELFESIIQHYDTLTKRECNNSQSLSQYIHVVYNKILLKLIKVYGVIVYLSLSLTMKDTSYHRTIELKSVINDFREQILKITNNAVKAMNKESSRYIFQGDPTNHEKGITYESLDYFLQDYVTDLKYLRQDGMCTMTCSVYDDTIHRDHFDRHFAPKNSICTGRIRTCSDTAVNKMCLAPLNSTRRYVGLSHIATFRTAPKYWGRTSNDCNVWTASNVWFSEPHCRICSCTCDMIDSQKSIRYVDLRPRRSKSFDSFVITGIRFKIINRILFIQIQEGILQSGKIIPETVTWKQIEDTDCDHDDDGRLFKLDYDNRLFDLTDLSLPDNYAIIMVGFTVINGVIGLQIRGRLMSGAEYNGPIYYRQSKQSAQSASFRPLFKPDGLDIPTIRNTKNDKITEPNKYLVKLETSDWENDAGQNVVPFIDLQDVVTDPPAPIAGVGIHVRHGGTSGGFLAPKLISTNKEMEQATNDITRILSSFHSNIAIKRGAHRNQSPRIKNIRNQHSHAEVHNPVFSQWGG